MFHVAVIVAAYGFFGISCLLGLTNMVLMSLTGEKNAGIFKMRVCELSIVNEMSLLMGLVLMTAGTLLVLFGLMNPGGGIGDGIQKKPGRWLLW